MRENFAPDDKQHSRMANLMQDWTRWMMSVPDERYRIDRWFWFDTIAGDDSLDAQLDMTGWLFQEHLYAANGNVKASNSTSIQDSTLGPPHENRGWEGATVVVRESKQGRRVDRFDLSTHTIYVKEPFTVTPTVNDTYQLALWEYPSRTPNGLGLVYSSLCHPGAFPKVHLPFVALSNSEGQTQALNTSENVLGRTESLFDSPLPQPPTASTIRVIDDFEYEDSPTLHGWYILDSQGNLDTLHYKWNGRRLAPKTPTNRDTEISFTYPGDPKDERNINNSLPFLTFEFSDFDGWWVSVDVVGTDKKDYTLTYRPEFGAPSIKRNGKVTTIEYRIGEGFIDNQWHKFARNLAVDLERMVPGVGLEVVKRITFNGPDLLDNVILSQPPILNDPAPPESQVHLEGVKDTKGNFTSPVWVSITASDGEVGAGVEDVFVRVNGRSWHKAARHRSLFDKDGEYIIETYAVDKAGNVSDIQTTTVRIKQSNR